MTANMLLTEYISWIIKHLESVQLFCRIYTVLNICIRNL